MESSRRLIIVSNRLPFQLVKQDKQIKVRQSDGGLVSALNAYFEKHADTDSPVWIGSASFNEVIWEKFKKKKTEQRDIQIEPLFPEKKLYNKYYNGFCNATVWPLFHYFPSFVEFDNETFKSYEIVNQMFAEKVLSIAKPGDVVWVHDYQLMLLPQMIREKNPDVSIGFFLHIPFPSYEIFRLMHKSWKEKIIEGLLGADLIGFHTHEYVQHFLKTVQMIKGVDHEFRTLFLHNRSIRVEMFPLGIDFEKFNQAKDNAQIAELAQTFKNNFQGKKIIFSVDRLDYTKGITHRLSGFEKFLAQHPDWIEKVVFVLDVVPSREILSRYNERKKLIEELTGRINGKYSTFGWQPIVYRYNHLSFEELCAMYSAADIALITPLRDGMNLVAKEYVACREDTGVLILSEFAGASSELSESISVNPLDNEEVSQAILRGLTMPPADQERTIKSLQERLKNYTVFNWVDDFLMQLNDVKSLQHAQQTKNLNDERQEAIINKFRMANRRLILLDYDGTLVPIARHPDMAVPNEEVINLVREISSDMRTDVTIISGRDQQFLDKWFGGLPVSLVAEHGACTRLKNENWSSDFKADFVWKKLIKPTLEIFTQRSPGAYIEEKTHTLAWHYRNVERELGFIRSRELLDNLFNLTRNSQLQIIDGNKVIEVRTAGIDKGAAAKTMICLADYDFVLAIGDDKTDEDMFSVLSDTGYTVKVGISHTRAKYQVPAQEDAIKMLSRLAKKVEPVS